MTAQSLLLTRDEIIDIVPALLYGTNPITGQVRRRSLALIGPVGTGKTSLLADLAREPRFVARYNELTGLNRDSVPLYMTVCHPDASAPEVIAQYLPLDGVWTYLPQSMLRAWGYGWDIEHVDDLSTGIDAVTQSPPPGMHVLDDAHLMGPGGQAAMYRALDSGAGGCVLDPRGFTIFPHPATTSALTMNGEITDLDPAVVDRLSTKIQVMEPSTAMLSALAPDLRELCEADYTDNPSPTASYREWSDINEARPQIGLAKAVLVALGSPSRAQKLIEGLAQAEAQLNPSCREAREALREIIASTPSAV